MDFVIRILKKYLVNEMNWERMEHKGEKEKKYAVGAELARKRIPQLKKAIELLGDYQRSQANKQVEHPVSAGVSAQAPQQKTFPVPAAESPGPGQEKCR